MFCWQCEQTSDGTGCVRSGVCGKTGRISALADLLSVGVKRLALAAKAKRSSGRPDREADRLLIKGLTVNSTGMSFDSVSLSALIGDVEACFERIAGELGESFWKGPDFKLSETVSGREEQGAELPLGSFPEIEERLSPQVVSMRESALYALKGAAGYAYQAKKFDREDWEIYQGVEDILSMSLDPALSMEDWLESFRRAGRISLRAMEILDEARTTIFGHPAPTMATMGRKRGKAILVSGNSLGDLNALLDQVEGRDVSVYTHGGLLSSHGYPAFRRGALSGHYGTGWSNQDDEFRRFPGPVVLAGGCLRRPHPAYRDRVFCSAGAAWPGVVRVEADSDGRKDFGPVIEAALECPGFESGSWGPFAAVGWGRKALLDAVSAIAGFIEAGRIGNILIIGGCDGSKAFRLYYRRLVELAPKDSLILTMGCGKSRFIDLSLGGIDGIPRMLDLGQCADAYSAMVLISSLASILDAAPGDLPVKAFLSWHEQKALGILAALMGLGIRGITLGPAIPAFFHSDVLSLFAATNGLREVSNPEADLAAALGEGCEIAPSGIEAPPKGFDHWTGRGGLSFGPAKSRKRASETGGG